MTGTGEIQKYIIEIVPEKEGVVARVPDLPGCAVSAENAHVALNKVYEAQTFWIKEKVAAGEALPEPRSDEDYSGKFVLRLPKSLHRSLDREARQQGVSLNQLVVHLLSERLVLSIVEQNIKKLLGSASIQQQCFVHYDLNRKEAGGGGWHFLFEGHQTKHVPDSSGFEMDPFVNLGSIPSPPLNAKFIVRNIPKELESKWQELQQETKKER